MPILLVSFQNCSSHSASISAESTDIDNLQESKIIGIINGECSSILNKCTSGSFRDVLDTQSEFKWKCLGTRGGSTMSCTFVKPPPAPRPLPIVRPPSGIQQFEFAHDLKYPGVRGDITFDFYHPKDYKNRKNLPVFIWIHGGGYASGDKSDDRALAVKIAELGFVVLNLNYTLAQAATVLYPQTLPAMQPYSIGIQDILSAIEYLKLHAQSFNIDPNKISIGGASAGGHLALMATTSGATVFNCTVNVAGPTDLLLASQMLNFPVTAWVAKSYYGENESVLKAYSPLHQINQIQSRRMYFLHQVKDNLVPIQHSRLFLETARPRFGGAAESYFMNDSLPAGIPYEYPSPSQATHNFRSSNTAISRVTSFLRSKCY